MRITGVRTYVTWAGLRNWVIVKVTTDRGIHGWGEATLEGREQTVRGCVHEMGEALVGEDPVRTEDHWQRLYRRFWRGGVVLNSALAALDQALWDIRGRAWGVPVYALLGGPVRGKLRLYTHVGMYDPGRMEDEAQRDVADGFTAVKTGAWLGDSHLPESEWISVVVDRVARLRAAIGPITDLMVDNHGRSRAGTAARLIEALRPHRPLWLEEPTAPEDLQALARVRAAANTVDIAVGERLYSKWEFAPLLEQRVVDVIQPDLSHAGGITECKKVAAMAEAHQVLVAPHNPQGPVSTAAAAHLAMAIPNFAILEFVRAEEQSERVLRETWPVRDGHLEVPDVPGLGVELDEEGLAARPYRSLRTPRAYTADGAVADV